MDEIRALYNVAHLESSKCEDLLKLSANSDDKVIRGYWAAARMISSKYLINPFIIIKVFNEGKKILEKLIEDYPQEAELRYLRYTIQMNTPTFVGYHKNKVEDRKKLLDFLNSDGEKKLKEQIIFYLKNTNDLKENEPGFN